MTDPAAPVVAIDGPSASGKGTVSRSVAMALGFHFLDSGALYRLVGLAAVDRGANLQDTAAMADLARELDAEFKGDAIWLDRREVTDAIRDERVSAAASQVAAIPAVREALLERQRAFRKLPGLVADGRDMGSVVFPDAALKIYLTADAAERARRRYNQLIEKGLDANIDALLREIRKRDARDSGRAAAPLQKSADAVELDTTGLSVEAVVTEILALYKRKAAKAP
jgi:cytidylate kinase